MSSDFSYLVSRSQNRIMAEESFQLPSEQNLDYHIVQLFDRLETMRRDKQNGLQIVGGRLAPVRPSMHAEIRTVEFWRYVK